MQPIERPRMQRRRPAASFCNPDSLQSASELQERLDQACRGRLMTASYVGVTNGHGSFLAQHAAESTATLGGNIRLGCLIKVFTATLATAAARDGLLRFEESLPSLPRFADNTVFQLLSHTHGLDGTGICDVPFTSDGLIDIESLQEVLLSTPRVSEPGQHYSYGNAGAWLVGASLERLHAVRYRDQLQTLLDTIDRTSGARNVLPPTVCPATGGSCAIRIESLLGLLRLHLGPGLSRMREPLFAIEPWSGEKAVSAGWKYHGEGWFGHSVRFPDWSAIMRLHPARNAGYVVACADPAAFLLQSRLFGSHIPDLRNMRIPTPQPRESVDGEDLDSCAGGYANAATRFDVGRGGDASLAATLQTEAPSGHRTELTLKLIPCGGRVFIADPPLRELPTVAQFVGTAASRPSHLWNGRQLLRRTD